MKTELQMVEEKFRFKNQDWTMKENYILLLNSLKFSQMNKIANRFFKLRVLYVSNNFIIYEIEAELLLSPFNERLDFFSNRERETRQ